MLGFKLGLEQQKHGEHSLKERKRKGKDNIDKKKRKGKEKDNQVDVNRSQNRTLAYVTDLGTKEQIRSDLDIL